MMNCHFFHFCTLFCCTAALASTNPLASMSCCCIVLDGILSAGVLFSFSPPLSIHDRFHSLCFPTYTFKCHHFCNSVYHQQMLDKQAKNESSVLLLLSLLLLLLLIFLLLSNVCFVEIAVAIVAFISTLLHSHVCSVICCAVVIFHTQCYVEHD